MHPGFGSPRRSSGQDRAGVLATKIYDHREIESRLGLGQARNPRHPNTYTHAPAHATTTPFTIEKDSYRRTEDTDTYNKEEQHHHYHSLHPHPNHHYPDPQPSPAQHHYPDGYHLRVSSPPLLLPLP